MTDIEAAAITAAVTKIEPAADVDLVTIRNQFAPNATTAELRYFARVASHLQLDPWAGHIVLVPRYDKRLGVNVHRPEMTVAGRRFIAQRTGRYGGVDGPYWCGPDHNAAGGHDWSDVWDDDDNYPYAARCFVHFTGEIVPANGTVKWSEFAQYDRYDKLLPTWKAMPSHMLGKVAESLALRRAFAEVAAAVHIVEGDDDDAQLAAEAAASLPPPPAPTPPRGTPRGDQVPIDVYDNLPEARGWK